MIRIGSVRGRPGFNSQLGSIFLFSFGAIALLRWLMFLLVEREQSARMDSSICIYPSQQLHFPIRLVTKSIGVKRQLLPS